MPKDSTATEQHSNEQSQPETDNQETEPVEEEGNSEEQAAEEGEQPEGEQADESFTSAVDPNKLPKELKEVYKNMQADFTRKSQELSEARKKAQLYDQLQQEEIIKSKFPKIEEKSKPSNETTDYLAQSLGVGYLLSFRLW